MQTEGLNFTSTGVRAEKLVKLMSVKYHFVAHVLRSVERMKLVLVDKQ